MSKIMRLLLLLAVLAGVAGYKSHSDSHEYVPDKGWQQN